MKSSVLESSSALQQSHHPKDEICSGDILHIMFIGLSEFFDVEPIGAWHNAEVNQDDGGNAKSCYQPVLCDEY